MRLETLVLELMADTSQLNRDVDKAINKAAEKVKGLENKSVTVNAPLKHLIALNKELDLKQKHILETERFAKNHPIVVPVDTSQVKTAKQELKGFSQETVKAQKELDTLYSKAKDFTVKGKVEIQETRTVTENVKVKRQASRSESEGANLGKEFSKEIKKGFKELQGGNIFKGLLTIATSPLRSIYSGFYEGIGLTASQKFAAGAIRSFEKEWNFTLNKIGDSVGTSFGKAGKMGADVLLRSMGTSTESVGSLFDELNRSFVDIFDEGEAKKRINNIADALHDTLIAAFKEGTFLNSGLDDLREAINEYRSLRKENINQRRQEAASKTAKAAQSVSVVVPDFGNKQRVVLFSPGFAGTKGQGVAGRKDTLSNAYDSNTAVIDMPNESTDTSVGAGEKPLQWLVEATKKVAQLNLSGNVNPDVVKLVATALEIRKTNPKITIEFVGHSAGGLLAQEAQTIYEQITGEKVKAVGIGTPTPIGGNGNFQTLIGQGDQVRSIANVAGAVGLGITGGDGIEGINAHDLESYLANPQVQKALGIEAFQPTSKPNQGNKKGNVNNLLQEVGQGVVLGAAKVAQTTTQVATNVIPPLATETAAIAKEIGKGAAIATKDVALDVAKKRRTEILKNQAVPLAVELSKTESVKVDEKPLVFVVGGNGGHGGMGAPFLQKNLKGFIGNKTANIVPIATPNTDYTKYKPHTGDSLTLAQHAQNMFEEARKGIKQFEKPIYNNLVSGFNPDAVMLASKVMAALQQDQNANISLLGHSGGGQVVEEAIAILEMAGIKNVKGMGIGSLDFGVTPETENYTRLMGEEDPFGKRFNRIKKQGNIKSKGQLTDLETHAASEYLAHTETLSNLPKVLQRNAVQKTLEMQSQKVLMPLMELYLNAVTSPLTDIKSANMMSMIGGMNVNNSDTSKMMELLKGEIAYGEELIAQFKDVLGEEVVKEIKDFYSTIKQELGVGNLQQQNISLLMPSKADIYYFNDFVKKENTQRLDKNTDQSTDPWNENFNVDAFTVELPKVKVLPKKRTKKQKESAEVNPFESAKTVSKQVKEKTDTSFAQLIAINQQILAEMKAIHSTLGKTPKGMSDNVPVYNAEFVGQDITGGLANIENTPEVGLFKKMLRGLGNIAQQHYGVAKGIEKYAFDTVQILSVGMVNLHAAKKVTQTVAPAIALGMAGHNVPLLGAGMDAISSGVITPLIGGGVGNLGGAIAGLLPEGIVHGATVAAGFLSHVPGMSALGGGVAEAGSAGIGLLGTGLTYLLGGNAVAKGGQFALNQAIKPLGLLPPSNADAKTYNALTGAGNFINNVTNAIGGQKPLGLPILPPRPVEYVHAEVVDNTPISPVYAMTGRNNMALPPSGGMARNITEEVKRLEDTLKNAIDEDSLPLIQDAIKRTEEISKLFSSFYADLKDTVKQGNLQLAKAQAETLLNTQNYARQEIDKMLADLDSVGLNTALGTSGVIGKMRGIKGHFTSREKGTQKLVNEVNQKEKNALYVDAIPYHKLFAEKSIQMQQKGVNSGEIEKAAAKLYSVFNQLKDIDLNSLGRDAIKGLRKGLLDEQGNLDATVKELAEGLPADVKKILKIQSPSRVFEEIGRNVTEGFQRGVEGLREFPVIGDLINQLGRLKNLIISIGVAGAGAIGLFLIGKQLTNIATESVKVYRNFEGIFIASKTIGNGAEFLGNVRKQVKALGGDLETTMRQGQQFVTGLVGTNLERRAESMFFDADAALKSLGLQTQQYDSAILAIKQVAAKGRVSLEEISGQLGESVPGALNIAAQAMNTNVQGFIQLVESGNLLSEDFLPRFIERLKAQTAFLRPEMEKSLNASIGRLVANYTDLQVNIGASLSPAVAGFVNLLSKGLESVNENFDEILLGIKTLAIALAMPALLQGGILIGKGFQFLTNWLIQASVAAQTANKSLLSVIATATGSALLKGGLLVGAAISATTAIEGAMFLMQDGSKDAKSALEGLENTVNSLSDAYAKAYGMAEETNKKIEGTGNVFLDFTDKLINAFNAFNQKFTPFLPELKTYAQAQGEQDDAIIQEGLLKAQEGRFFQRNLQDQDKINDYIKQVVELDNKIGAVTARIRALRLIDPVGNAPLIKQLEDSVYGKGGLTDQREGIAGRFLAGGEAGLEQTIKSLEEFKKLAEDRGKTEAVKAFNKEIEFTKESLNRIKAINADISSGINKQRLAYLDLNKEIARSQETLQRRNTAIDINFLREQLGSTLGSNNVAYRQALNEVTKQQNTVNTLLNEQARRENFLKNKVENSVRLSVFELVGKELDQIDKGDIDYLQKILSGRQVGQQAIEEVTDTLTAFVDGKANLQQAQKALLEAQLAFKAQGREVADYNRELARSIEDFNLDLARQQLDVNLQIRDHNRRIEDAAIQATRENRDLAESYADLMADLQTQLKTAQNEFLDIQDKIKSVQLKTEILGISPGFDSYGKQIANIFANLRDALAGNESESRNLETKQAQIGREYINTLRRIRSEQERQLDAERNRTRAIQDLAVSTVQLMMNLSQILLKLNRDIEDRNRENFRRTGDSTRKFNGNITTPSINNNPATVPNSQPLLPKPPKTKASNPFEHLPMGQEKMALNFGIPEGIANDQAIVAGDLLGLFREGKKILEGQIKEAGDILRNTFQQVIPTPSKIDKGLGIIQNLPLINDRKKWDVRAWARFYLVNIKKIKGDVTKQINALMQGKSPFLKEFESYLLQEKDVNSQVLKTVTQLYESQKRASQSNPSSKPTRPIQTKPIEDHRTAIGKVQREIKKAESASGQAVQNIVLTMEQRLLLANNYLKELVKRFGLSTASINAANIKLLAEYRFDPAKFSIKGLPQGTDVQGSFEQYARQEALAGRVPKPNQQKKPRQTTKKSITQGTPNFNQVQRDISNQESVYRQMMPQLPSLPNFNASNNLAEQIRDQQLLNNEKEKELNIENKKLAIAQAVDAIAQFKETISEADKTNSRSIEDSIYSINEMIANSKGYLTVQEQIEQSVNNVAGQYRSQLRSLLDQKAALEKIQTSGLEQLNKNKELLKSLDLTDEQRKQLSEDIAIIEQKLGNIPQQLKDIGDLINANRYYDKVNQDATRLLETENKRIEALKTMADLQSNLANAQYNQGGTLINQAPIIKAQAEAMTVEYESRKKAQSMFEDTAKQEEFVRLNKELADINLKQSYVDAIPFLKEFSTGLRDVILQTDTWQNALKKLLDLVAGTILDQLVIKPMQNWIAGTIQGLGLFGFAQGTDYFIPNYANGIDEALTRERAMSGKKPYLAALHEGEAVLSTLNGDAELYRALKASGEWNHLKASVPNYAQGTPAPTVQRSQSGGGVTVVQTFNIRTDNADSFRKSQSRIDSESAARMRRTMRR